MKTARLITIFLLLIISTKAGPQASWSFTIWFNVYDAKDRPFTVEDFRNGKVKLLTSGNGAFYADYFRYDTINKCFLFKQSTITTTGVIAFVHEKDTTTIQITTHDIYLPKIKAIPGTFFMHYWRHEQDFDCNRKIKAYYKDSICSIKYEMEHYRVKDEKKWHEEFKEMRLSY